MTSSAVNCIVSGEVTRNWRGERTAKVNYNVATDTSDCNYLLLKQMQGLSVYCNFLLPRDMLTQLNGRIIAFRLYGLQSADHRWSQRHGVALTDLVKCNCGDMVCPVNLKQFEVAC